MSIKRLETTQKRLQKIARAYSGDLEQTRYFLDAWCTVASKTNHNDHVLEAYTWYTRLLLRLAQDMTCSTDASDKGALGNITLNYGPTLQKLMKQCGKEHEIKTIHKKSLDEAVAWVQDLAEHDRLVSPHGIKKYGMGVFLDHFNPDKQNPSPDKLIPESEWKQKRLEILTSFKTSSNT